MAPRRASHDRRGDRRRTMPRRSQPLLGRMACPPALPVPPAGVPPLPSGMPAPLLAPGPALWRLHAVWGVASAASLGAPPRGFVLGAPLLAGGSEVDALEAAEAAALRVELLQKAPPAAPAGLLGDGASLGRSPFDFRIDSAGRAPRRAGRVRSHHKGGLVRPATTATAQASSRPSGIMLADRGAFLWTCTSTTTTQKAARSATTSP
ncbi:unnamed protein product [Prorocentrum cordatum]|uniref:Uncharacterized protein n=1 Tax=Prorocentrum cordatum TaxID=2364126 RepID=A0ABN9SIY9_9DINO|nr:unnamed protein product [Polarella glacialis]